MTKIKEKVLKEPVTEEEHRAFMKLFKGEFGHPTEIPIEFERMIAFSRYMDIKTLAEVGKVIDNCKCDCAYRINIVELKKEIGI